MKISASIYCDTHRLLPETIQELDAHFIDLFHVDCNDDPGVFEDIKTIKRHSRIPVDLHIISPAPQQYFHLLETTPVHQVSFQVECFQEILHIPATVPGQIGIAMTHETPIEAFLPYTERCSYVLLMTTTPGKGGGVFNKDTFRKIRQFRQMFPAHRIQVDGGVNAEVSFILRNLGVDSAVAGSFLFKNKALGPSLLQLKKEVVSSHFKVRDFMIEKPELPVLDISELTFERILLTIDKYEMAFVLITDNHKLLGLVSNADVRKGIIRHLHDLQNIDPQTMINKTPLVCQEENTIEELLRTVKNAKFPIQYLPVVNDKFELTGALTFTQLIKAES